MPVTVPRDRILTFFARQGGRPQKAKDVGKALGLSADDRSSVRAALNALVDEGVLTMLEGRRYVMAGESNTHKGTVQRKATGSAWFIPDDKSVGDAFIPPQELTSVVDGDAVLARLERAPKGPVAKIVRVVAHRRTTVTGILVESSRARWVEVDDNVLSGPVVIPAGPEGNADNVAAGEVVEVLLVEYPTSVTTAVGRIVRSLGQRGRIDVEVERILAEKKIVKAFPPEVEDEAAKHPADPTAEDWAGRVDLRDTALVTIDGETAKDFDDAVFAVRRGKDIHVIVAIADVSHYVKAGAPLDVEAARRGTSIYYPGKVIPMLPEALSNGLCSLRPHVDRLCMVAEFDVRPDGSRHKPKFYNAVMRSHARLTYTLAQKFYDGDEDAAKEMSLEVQESLRALHEASQRLRAARKARGALDFDLPETVIALDDKGEPMKIHPLERLNAHKLIEDLMVAANEVVAERFEERGWPCIYRIHEPPDVEKLERFAKLAQLVAGRRIPELDGTRGAPTPKALMAVMAELGDTPARRALDSLLLRSMMQAKYSPDNVGHYGLGSEAYLHFTSPIRRYPDLVVHRLLKMRLTTRKKIDDDALLPILDDIASTSSQCERVATDIERAVDALYAAWFMKDRVGEVFDGVVQGVAEFGLFVTLTDAFVEGMIRVSDLGRDYFVFDEVRLRLVGERSGKVYTVGDVVRVKIAGVDLARRQIGLVLESMDQDEGFAPRERRPRDFDDGDRPRRRGGRDERAAAGRSERRDGKRTKAAKKRGTFTERAEREQRHPRRDTARKSERDERPQKKGGRVEEVPRRRPSPPAEDAGPKPRPKISGPKDLRRIWEERAKGGGPGRGGSKPKKRR
jgi:ribonuclease R